MRRACGNFHARSGARGAASRSCQLWCAYLCRRAARHEAHLCHRCKAVLHLDVGTAAGRATFTRGTCRSSRTRGAARLSRAASQSPATAGECLVRTVLGRAGGAQTWSWPAYTSTPRRCGPSPEQAPPVPGRALTAELPRSSPRQRTLACTPAAGWVPGRAEPPFRGAVRCSRRG